MNQNLHYVQKQGVKHAKTGRRLKEADVKGDLNRQDGRPLDRITA